MTVVGYAQLTQHPEVKAKRPTTVAEVRPVRRDERWRVAFNGIGSMDYCTTGYFSA